MRPQRNSYKHVYLVCHRCGKLAELPTNELDELASRWRVRYGFELHLTHLALPGRCSGCADESGRKERAM